jgi:tocopherol cyclase
LTLVLFEVTIMYSVLKIFKPEIFQGKYKSKNYFEGWYFKLADESEKNLFAVIPGISYGQFKEDDHAFIQVLDSSNYKTYYFKYDISKFKYSKTDFSICIDDNTFDRNKIYLNLQQGEFRIRGMLEFYDIIPFPKTIFNPGIMGPFSFVPFMECYHDIINIQHRIEGSIFIDDNKIDFTKGNGYIEKDWGKSFPEWWIWVQSNHFEEGNASLMFSIAKIPWFNKHFTGFTSFLRIDKKLYRFATYTGAKIGHLEYKNGNVKIMVSDKRYSMTISGKYNESGVLKAPQNGLMYREIAESISSNVEVALKDYKGNLIFNGIGNNAGMEIVREW